MNYLLPPEWTTTFVPLQDKCPVSSYESIEEVFLKDTGQPISDFFTEFARLPIGAASLAQVHLATLRETGEKVAVKVQHPNLAEWAELDLALTKFTFSMLKRFFPSYDLSWLSSEMASSLPQELDFRLEAGNARRAKAHFAPLGLPLTIPTVVWARARILVMEAVSGARTDDLAFLDAHDIDRDEVSACLARIFNEMIFGRDAPLHCDPHGGNLAIRSRPRASPNFDIVLYDHGLYREIPARLRRDYARLWLAVLDGDEPRMRRHARDVAGISDAQFPLFASAITGRDYTGAAGDGTARRDESLARMLTADDVLARLVQMLGQVPRVMLLILKTNDLTRSLDEGLQTRQGPVRAFLILARYAARALFDEEVQAVEAERHWWRRWWRLGAAYRRLWRVEARLRLFEAWVGIKRFCS
jgi:aarF domain-containing kinase